MPSARSIALGLLLPVTALHAQPRGDAPVAPAATIGPVSDASTLSVLGLASPATGTAGLAPRSAIWFGASQPVARMGRLRVAAVGSGHWRARDGIGGDATAQGIVALRARARVGSQRLWSAVSYGGTSLDGSQASGLLGGTPVSMSDQPMRSGTLDTTYARRVDIGRLGRVEAGMVSVVRGVELSLGVSVERASRLTTQTITVSEQDAVPVMSAVGLVRRSTTRIQRTTQRRDVASGIAALGFNTGPTTWLVSVTTPVATWLTDEPLAPQAAPVPTVASVAVVQPVAGWLSLVAAATSNPATMGGAQFRDAVTGNRHGFAPVVALGVRIARLHDRDADGTPGGILAFETRTLGAVDSVSVERAAEAAERMEGDTLRVVLLIDAPRAESVELMGDATEWSVRPMRRAVSGRWRAELKLAPGMHRLIVRADGGKWIAPPGLPVASDDYGTPTGMIIVRGRR